MTVQWLPGWATQESAQKTGSGGAEGGEESG